MANKKDSFLDGIKAGIPISLGYFSVSFSFGIIAILSGLSIWQAAILSMTNLTSAGQVAGVGIMAASGSLIEMAISQFVINIRYSLMAISLSQKIDKKFPFLLRFFLSAGITDEIFGVAMGTKNSVGPRFLAGLIALPFIGWTSGTILGAIGGSFLPEYITNALAIGIFGMFIAIVIPEVKKSPPIAIVCAISVVLSCVFKFAPIFQNISSGFAYIISAVLATLFGVFAFKDANSTESSKEETHG